MTSDSDVPRKLVRAWWHEQGPSPRRTLGSPPRQLRTCSHGVRDEFCWRVTCKNGRYGWFLIFSFSVMVGTFIWLGLMLGLIAPQ